MILLINIVNLSKGQILTKQEIEKLVNSSRSTFQYCKFNLYNKIHLTINYSRDMKITIATNSRDIALYKEIQSLENIYTQQRVINFFFRWVNKLNK